MDTVTYFGYLILGINFIIYLLKFKKNIEHPYKIFLFYLLVLVSIQIISEYIQKATESGNNLYLTHYYFIIQNILLSYFYYLIIESKNLSVTELPKMHQ